MAFRAYAPRICLLMYFARLAVADTTLSGFQTIRLPPNYLRTRQNVVMIDNGVIICQNGQCYYNSFEQLNRTYPGLFPTVEVYQRQTGLPVRVTNTCSHISAQKSSSRDPTNDTVCIAGSGDGDDCCQTFKSIVPYESLSDFRRRTNMNGQLCYSIQLFTIGTCGDSRSSNECDECVQETNLVSLYSYNYATSDVGFNFFHIESFCSCKA